MDQNDRSITGFTMVSHALVHTYELSIPILMTIWLTRFDVTTALLGGIVTVGYALFGIGALPSGILTDRFPAKSLIVASLVGMGGAFLLLSVAQDVIMITVALAIWGAVASVHHPAALSLISTGVDDRGTGFAYHGMAGNIGIAFGPLITAILLLSFEWRTVTVLLVLPAAAGVIYATFIDFDEHGAEAPEDEAEPEAESQSLSAIFHDTKQLFAAGFGFVLLAVLCNGLFYRGTLTFLPDLLSNWLSLDLTGLPLLDMDNTVGQEFNAARYLYVALLMAGIGGQYVGGKVSSRVEIERALGGVFLVLAVLAIAFVPVATAGTLPLVIITGIFGFALFAIQPLYQATIAEHSRSSDRGLSYGLTYFSNFGVGALGAAMTGVLLTRFIPRTVFLVLAFIPLAGAAISWIVLSRL